MTKAQKPTTAEMQAATSRVLESFCTDLSRNSETIADLPENGGTPIEDSSTAAVDEMPAEKTHTSHLQEVPDPPTAERAQLLHRIAALKEASGALPSQPFALHLSLVLNTPIARDTNRRGSSVGAGCYR